MFQLIPVCSIIPDTGLRNLLQVNLYKKPACLICFLSQVFSCKSFQHHIGCRCSTEVCWRTSVSLCRFLVQGSWACVRAQVWVTVTNCRVKHLKYCNILPVVKALISHRNRTIKTQHTKTLKRTLCPGRHDFYLKIQSEKYHFLDCHTGIEYWSNGKRKARENTASDYVGFSHPAQQMVAYFRERIFLGTGIHK